METLKKIKNPEAEAKIVKTKHAELSDDELVQVSGGDWEYKEHEVSLDSN